MDPNPSIATRFKPGQSGNPSGRPRGKSVSARIAELLEANQVPGVEIPAGRQLADLVAEMIVKEVVKGNAKFTELLMDRTEGKVKETLEHSGGVTVRVVYADDDEHEDADDHAAEIAPGPGEDPA